MNRVVLLSGGLDSTALLSTLVKDSGSLVAVSARYGQRHAKEVEAAAEIAAFYDIPHVVLDLTSWGRLLFGSSLTDPSVPVPHGHYAAATMRSTVVPNRNAMMLMAAAGIALAVSPDEPSEVLTAVHAGDHAVYPDCRPEFIESASRTAQFGTEGMVSIRAPFVHLTKTDIARIGVANEAPLHLTWSCYEGGELHCGQCGTCVERREAFEQAGVPDPTQYVR